MVDDPGTDIQQQDLIGSDVADALQNVTGDAEPATTIQPDPVQPVTPDPVQPMPPASDDSASSPSEPSSEEPAVTPQPVTLPKPVNTDDVVAPDELHEIKQQALEQLGPLVEHIDQEPEDRFNTLMMMIRASDNADLVKPAYEAAQAISDDNARAQALLDVVNEVNYLTRPQDAETD
jgi:hypothetical protein